MTGIPEVQLHSVNRAYKIGKAASKTDGRYAFSGVRIDPTAGCAVATNGRMLAMVPLANGKREDESAFTVPSEVVSMGFKGGKTATGGEVHFQSELTSDGITRSVSSSYRGAVSSALEPAGEFPDYKAVLPDRNGATGETVRIRLNAGYLRALADALGAEDSGVELEFELAEKRDRDLSRTTAKAITVRPLGAPDDRNSAVEPIGVLMPIFFDS